MPLDGSPGNADDLADVPGEIAFAPKELKVAQDLSARLGTYTYRGRSHRGPALLGKGSRSLTESDQRRPLMLPQELIQMPQDRLLVLRAGLPPIRGRKIVYWREKAFARRLQPPPSLPTPAVAAPAPEPTAPPVSAARPGSARGRGEDPLTLDLVLPLLEAEGLAPLPPEGASPAEVEAWVDRFIDASAQPQDLEVHRAR